MKQVAKEVQKQGAKQLPLKEFTDLPQLSTFSASFGYQIKLSQLSSSRKIYGSALSVRNSIET